MTKDEFKILAKGLKAVYTYPSFLPDADSLNVWYGLLQDLPYDVCNVAIQKYMMTEKEVPKIADIRNMCAEIMAGEKPLWSDGWEEVLRAIREYGSWNEAKALESMSEITRQTVRRMGFINICRSEEISVERANFRMIFEQIANKEHEKAKIPLQIRQLIATIQDKKMLELKENE
jgi:hypothetical protein